jgi:large subunit ribosomal protein L21
MRCPRHLSGKLAGPSKPAPAAAPKDARREKDRTEMFAVIKTGGKQYRVAAQDVITIEKLPAEVGASVTFEEVLLVGDDDTATIGAPLIAGASVSGEVVEQTRGDKVRVFKKKRRKNYRRTAGHRQHLTVVKITDILTGAATTAKPKSDAAEAAPQAGDAAPQNTEAAASPAETGTPVEPASDKE